MKFSRTSHAEKNGVPGTPDAQSLTLQGRQKEIAY